MELTGQRFGRLVVIGDSGKRDKYGNRYLKCKCDCGNEKNVRASHLTSEKIKSCGCLAKENSMKQIKKYGHMAPSRQKEKLLIGKRFGKLTVLKDTGKRNKTKSGGRNRIYLCQCDCGNAVEVQGRMLTQGKTKSCGHLFDEWLENDFVEGTKLTALKMKPSSLNTSGYKGVSYVKKEKKWKAYIYFKHKNYYLGLFSNKQDAINARGKAEEKYFKPTLDKYKKDSANGN